MPKLLNHTCIKLGSNSCNPHILSSISIQYTFIEEQFSGLLSQEKIRKEKFWISFIALLSHQKKSTVNSTNQEEFEYACQLSHQKENVVIQNYFLPCFYLSKLTKLYFFHRYICSFIKMYDHYRTMCPPSFKFF